MWYNDIKHTNHTLNNNKCAYALIDTSISIRFGATTKAGAEKLVAALYNTL